MFKGEQEMNTNNEFERTKGNRYLWGFRIQPQMKIIFSIVSTFVWIGFSLIWIAFLGSSYTIIQNLVLLAIAFVVFCASNAVLWVTD
jgi:hypothetical protein